MKLKPWYDVVKPREDLCQGKPLDASEFAVHLDQIRDRRAPDVYKEPDQFFERTYLTKSLTGLAAEVIRRLSGEKTETSAVFNMTTQFGGGKTHALTLLYHLAHGGVDARNWLGVPNILSIAGVSSVPKAATAVFVGTEFDALTGRGGTNGEPLRRTPWGEIAYQLGGEESFRVVAEHDREFIEPKGDVIRQFLPKNRPCLILMDEILNYASTYRVKGYHNALYNFLQALSETVRGENNVVMVVSLPKSELEYTAEDQEDEVRFKKMLDRLGKAVMMAAESETSEIIRRRLFDWEETERDENGKIYLNKEAIKTCEAFAEWVKDHRQQLPQWFPIDQAKETFEATFPFHPSVLSVFERKWQALPRFQRTRGVLRMLALWVSRNYDEAYKRNHKDPLIGLGTAPLNDPMFRSAIFEQIGEDRLEVPVVTDVCGRKDSHAERLDKEAVDTIRKGQLHRKISTAVFFESNGGQTRDEATLPEIRLGVGEPDVDVGNIETVLETLGSHCYYLTVERNRYRFSTSPNLNKLLSDRRAIIDDADIDKRVRAVVLKEFSSQGSVAIHPYPSSVNPIPDRPVLTFVVLSPDQLAETPEKTLEMVETMTRDHGGASRTFKSALVWCVPDSATALRDEVRKALAWENIEDNDIDRLDETQRRQLKRHLTESAGLLKEAVWRSYHFLIYLTKDNTLKTADLGFQHSRTAKSIIDNFLNQLRKDGEVEEWVNPTKLKDHWPPAFEEWSTKAVRDAFFASPVFPRLLDGSSIKETIANGVSNGLLAYLGKGPEGQYEPFYFETQLTADQIEISDSMYIATAETARKHIQPPVLTSLAVSPGSAFLKPGDSRQFTVSGLDQHGRTMNIEEVRWEATGGSIDESGLYSADGEGTFRITVTTGSISTSVSVQVLREERPSPPPKPEPGITKICWTGEVPPRKWTNFYSKVLSRFSGNEGMTLRVTFEIAPKDGISPQRIEETKSSLRELGLADDVESE